MARVDEEFEGAHRMFHVDFRTPPSFEARLRFDGYQRSETLVLVLEGELRGAPRPHEIHEIDNERDWAAYSALQRVDWDEFHTTGYAHEAPSAGDQMARTRRLKSPPLRYWLVYDEGEPRGYFSSWEGVDGIGQVEDLFVHPDWRHRGLGTTLIHQCVADARSRGAGPVVIATDPADTPKHMYAAMGWEPVAVKREYLRVMTEGA